MSADLKPRCVCSRFATTGSGCGAPDCMHGALLQRLATEQTLPVDSRPALPCVHDYTWLRTEIDPLGGGTATTEHFYCRRCAHVKRVHSTPLTHRRTPP